MHSVHTAHHKQVKLTFMLLIFPLFKAVFSENIGIFCSSATEYHPVLTKPLPFPFSSPRKISHYSHSRGNSKESSSFPLLCTPLYNSPVCGREIACSMLGPPLKATLNSVFSPNRSAKMEMSIAEAMSEDPVLSTERWTTFA